MSLLRPCAAIPNLRLCLFVFMLNNPTQALLTILDSPLNKAGKIKVCRQRGHTVMPAMDQCMRHTRTAVSWSDHQLGFPNDRVLQLLWLCLGHMHGMLPVRCA